jgi:uncharacterized delta-60 repeat protein
MGFGRWGVDVKAIVIAVALLVLDCSASLGSGELWSARYNGTGNGFDRATAVAVDSDGNVVVTGQSNGGGASGQDYATVKYSPVGSQLWVRRYNGTESTDDFATAIAVDSSGNVYVTGYCNYGPGAANDYTTIKYSPTGGLLWVSRYNAPYGSNDEAHAIAVDSDGNVYVTGSSNGDGTGQDYATVKYDTLGNQKWAARYNGPGNGSDNARAIALGPSGTVYVTGESYGGSGVGYDYATLKYNSSGAQQWAARYNGPPNGDDGAYGIAVSAGGEVFVTGASDGSGSGTDYATVKYNSGGGQSWLARYNGPANGDDSAYAIALDPWGSVCVTGQSRGLSSVTDYATVKYDPSGSQQWVARYNGPGNDNDGANAIVVDSDGNICVTGLSVGSGSDYDYATVKYDPWGSVQWTARYNGPANGFDEAKGIALDASGNVCVTGASAGSAMADYATLKYDGVPPAGVVSINSGAAYTTTTSVTLSLYASDAGTGVATMRFSNDGTGWTSWEAYATTRIWTLLPGNGLKKVFVQYKDQMGNTSTCADTIVLGTPVSLSSAKSAPAGTLVIVTGQVVTARFWWPSYDDFCYIEDPSRPCGIRMSETIGGCGAVLDVAGTTALVNDEKVLQPLTWKIVSRDGSVDPLGMTNKALGGGPWNYDSGTGSGQPGITDATGLNNIGLLVLVWGKVVEVNTSEKWYKLDDGSAVTLKVQLDDSTGSTLPKPNTYIWVKGISSCELYRGSLLRLVLVSSDSL